MAGAARRAPVKSARTRIRALDDRPHPLRPQSHRLPAYRRRAHLRYCWLEARRKTASSSCASDTDRERSAQAATRDPPRAMDWLGLNYDRPVYRPIASTATRKSPNSWSPQAMRITPTRPKEELEAMRRGGDGRERKPRYNSAYRDTDAGWRDDPNRVIRFRNPLDSSCRLGRQGQGAASRIADSRLDIVPVPFGRLSPPTTSRVVVDDIDMRISDVVRGDDHVSNTRARSTSTKRAGRAGAAFRAPADDPRRARREAPASAPGAADVMQYRDAGYLPHALLNYLVWLGWSHGDRKCFPSPKCSRCSTSPTSTPGLRLDPAKLGWLNQQYLKSDDPEAVASTCAPRTDAATTFPKARSPGHRDCLRERVQTPATWTETRGRR